MKMSIGQFVALVAVLVAMYFAYTMWWSKQSREDWINQFHHNVYDNEGEVDTSMPGEEEEKAGPDRVNGWIQ
jgi:hypothetical protein